MKLPHRLTDVLSRIRVDLDAALGHKRALAVAAARCERCGHKHECDEWVAAHGEGEGHAVPAFCPNAHFMRSVRPRNAG